MAENRVTGCSSTGLSPAVVGFLGQVDEPYRLLHALAVHLLGLFLLCQELLVEHRVDDRHRESGDHQAYYGRYWKMSFSR